MNSNRQKIETENASCTREFYSIQSSYVLLTICIQVSYQNVLSAQSARNPSDTSEKDIKGVVSLGIRQTTHF